MLISPRPRLTEEKRKWLADRLALLRQRAKDETPRGRSTRVGRLEMAIETLLNGTWPLSLRTASGLDSVLDSTPDFLLSPPERAELREMLEGIIRSLS